MSIKELDSFDVLQRDVVNRGLCTHCGTCAGLSKEKVYMQESTIGGPLPVRVMGKGKINDPVIVEACPGKGINYVDINQHHFGKIPENWSTGNWQIAGISYSNNQEIRSIGASGGIITQVMISLLENKTVEGVICCQLGKTVPYLAEPIIAYSIEEIKRCAQSIYTPVPVNKILEVSQRVKGKLAFVGLPDQISAIRYLQMIKHPSVANIYICIGPYVGINMYKESLLSFIKSNGYKSFEQIKETKYRDGEWPGYLSVTMNDGVVLKAKKFYYNYLLPFFITTSSLLTMDFSNELADISVGDAWHPKYEKIGKGFSVVLGRSKLGKDLIENLIDKKIISFSPIKQEDILDMHAHMFDFKKRGSYIRIKLRELIGLKSPAFGYVPSKIPLKRVIVELVICVVIILCSNKIARSILPVFPIGFTGRIFNFLRINWKKISKSMKRSGLATQKYKIIY